MTGPRIGSMAAAAVNTLTQRTLCGGSRAAAGF
jgi:hypothetical protein